MAQWRGKDMRNSVGVGALINSSEKGERTR